MLRQLIGATALAALAMSIGVEAAAPPTGATYHNGRGQWPRRIARGLGGQPSFDQTKPWGFGQQAPLTPEYTAVLEASLADQANGGQGNHTLGYGCSTYGMPL